MMVKVMSMSFNSVVEEFDDSELRELLKQFVVFDIRDYFFVKNEIPYLTFIVKYLPQRAAESAGTVQQQVEGANHRKYDESWKQELNESNMGLFELLRQWRSQRCKKEGVPPYILLTNRQLVDIVKSRPQSAAELAKIEGIGKGKLEKYAEEILAITKVDTGPVPPNPSASSEPDKGGEGS